jgi:hypothetical protein
MQRIRMDQGDPDRMTLLSPGLGAAGRGSLAEARASDGAGFERGPECIGPPAIILMVVVTAPPARIHGQA